MKSFALPALALLFTAPAVANPASEAPAPAQFGASLDTILPALETACARVDLRTLDPAELPIAQTSHVQADCHGLDHAGGERLAEFVFADDSLAFIWVLTEAEEAPALRAVLERAFDAPSHDTALFTAFADHRVALRHDIPELLYYSEAIAPMYRGWFDQMAAQ